MNNILSDATQIILREEKIITDNEVAINIGDKYVAENVISKTRRIIHVPERLVEAASNKRILKG